MRTRAVSISFDQSLPMMFALVLVACATTQALTSAVPRAGDVAMSVVKQPVEESYANAGDAQWDLPFPFEENETPVYPQELLSANLPPMTVRVRIIVDEHGSVVDSMALAVPPDYPQFFAVVQGAVHEWKFWPLVKWWGVAGTRTEIEFNGFVRTYEGSATALPFHQDYDITFTQKDGKGVVTSSAPAPRRADP